MADEPSLKVIGLGELSTRLLLPVRICVEILGAGGEQGFGDKEIFRRKEASASMVAASRGSEELKHCWSSARKKHVLDGEVGERIAEGLAATAEEIV